MPSDDKLQSQTSPSGPDDRLGPDHRRRSIERMASEEFDVVVIGGGATGAGCALDAASRGLSVALLEARDYAAGTSSRSSKLIHGGLRYLEQRDLRLVREALRERGLLLKTLAPHLVRPIPFLFPLDKHWETPYIGAGMIIYDTLGGGHQGVPGHRHLSKRKALRVAPALRDDALIGAFQYFDAQVDDARHTMTLARTAAHFGAAIANNIAVVGFLREGERVTGVVAKDAHTGEEHKVRAKQVINATGVWTDDIQNMVGERGKFHVRASKGVHLLIPRDRLQLDTGLILRTEKSVLFVIPWGRHWIVGTTDTDWELDRAHPAASRSDIDYIFEHVNKVLREPLTYKDVEGVYAGLRPLLSHESESTSQLSREHTVAVPVPGLVAVAGGKFTTYRVMAKDAVDAAARGLGGHVPASVTHETPLVGADGYFALRNRTETLAAETGLHPARIEHLLGRFGSRIFELTAEIARDPKLAEPLPGAEDYLAAEVRHAVTHEGAQHLEDVLTRRTRISIEAWDRGLASAEPAAELMADVLGWDRDTVAREVDIYRRRVAAERESQEQLDDRAADVARTSAPDVLPGSPPVAPSPRGS
ncbi:MAG TPA: glycerol-3-phosphate dehydrogenase/oxidase [Solirubrobacterales bacterium]|jgi:glycerol-3-phosphate dehydrogenase|nr:glycerol-3-phosphate dehydrogenase/oxidase [Solirubrobacterales bacterium]